MAHLVNAQGQIKLVYKSKKRKSSPLVALPTENPKPKTEQHFFQWKLENITNP